MDKAKASTVSNVLAAPLFSFNRHVVIERAAILHLPAIYEPVKNASLKHTLLTTGRDGYAVCSLLARSIRITKIISGLLLLTKAASRQCRCRRFG
jgi:hypothetical protein